MQYADITFTDLGAQKVREFLTAQDVDLASAEKRDDDHVYEDQGLQILVDQQSLPYVHGSQIDYVDAMTGAGFQVNNPNVVAACGCGSSFRVPEDEEGSPG